MEYVLEVMLDRVGTVGTAPTAYPKPLARAVSNISNSRLTLKAAPVLQCWNVGMLDATFYFLRP